MMNFNNGVELQAQLDQQLQLHQFQQLHQYLLPSPLTSAAAAAASSSAAAAIDSQDALLAHAVALYDEATNASASLTSSATAALMPKWSAADDELLRHSVQLNKSRGWKKIAFDAFGTSRTDVQCMHRYQKVLRPGLIKGTWTQEEDSIVLEGVKKYGIRKWSLIAMELSGRLGKQVRERYYNHLASDIRTDEWTPEEDQIILTAHAKYGNRWSRISKELNGRTDNAVKNRWNGVLGKVAAAQAATMKYGPSAGGAMNQNASLTTAATASTKLLASPQSSRQLFGTSSTSAVTQMDISPTRSSTSAVDESSPSRFQTKDTAALMEAPLSEEERSRMTISQQWLYNLQQLARLERNGKSEQMAAARRDDATTRNPSSLITPPAGLEYLFPSNPASNSKSVAASSAAHQYYSNAFSTTNPLSSSASSPLSSSTTSFVTVPSILRQNNSTNANKKRKFGVGTTPLVYSMNTPFGTASAAAAASTTNPPSVAAQLREMYTRLMMKEETMNKSDDDSRKKRAKYEHPTLESSTHLQQPASATVQPVPTSVTALTTASPSPDLGDPAVASTSAPNHQLNATSNEASPDPDDDPFHLGSFTTPLIQRDPLCQRASQFVENVRHERTSGSREALEKQREMVSAVLKTMAQSQLSQRRTQQKQLPRAASRKIQDVLNATSRHPFTSTRQ